LSASADQVTGYPARINVSPWTLGGSKKVFGQLSQPAHDREAQFFASVRSNESGE